MDEPTEKRLLDTVSDISKGMGELAREVSETRADVRSTKEHIGSVSRRLEALDVNGTRYCVANKTKIGEHAKRLDNLEKVKSANSRKPLVIGGISFAGVLTIYEGLKMWFGRETH